MSPYSFLLSLALAASSLPSVASAQEAPGLAHAGVAHAEVKAYAIIVGNNAGGPGQGDLHYAEADARRVSSVLRELGGYQFQEPELLLSPSPMQLWNTFEAVQTQIEADKRSGTDSVLFFYYSGHARAEALDLGPSQVELSDLRARIEVMPASLRVVVLDACQSGAISRIKGAKPAADFSTSSIASLGMTGLAIMASSTGAELSQESDALEGSYFTHHLVSGLRGAADKNRDGSVTLSEAYAYAYNTTLLATAVSAVGKQHVTLETDLRGNGDVALTRPADADARLSLPASLAAAVTISTRRSVVAEINKVAGESMVLALPRGRYSVIVRSDAQSARECDVRLRNSGTVALDWKNCAVLEIDDGTRKGGPSLAVVTQSEASNPSRWHLELNFGLRGTTSDAYTDRLETFGYERSPDAPFVNAHYNLKAYRDFDRHLQFGASLGVLESDSYRRHTDGASTYNLDWTTFHASALARLYQNFADGSGQVFAETSLGLSLAVSELREEEMNRDTTERDLGYAAMVSVGAIYMPFDSLGLLYSIGYSYAPTLDNELDESHAGAGFLSALGIVAVY